MSLYVFSERGRNELGLQPKKNYHGADDTMWYQDLHQIQRVQMTHVNRLKC
jgi:hypothetical protein